MLAKSGDALAYLRGRLWDAMEDFQRARHASGFARALIFGRWLGLRTAVWELEQTGDFSLSLEYEEDSA